LRTIQFEHSGAHDRIEAARPACPMQNGGVPSM
jgi:hypothetical protein